MSDRSTQRQRLGVIPGVVFLLPVLAGCYAAMVGGMVGMGAAMTFTGVRGMKACEAERQAVASYVDRLESPDSLAMLVPEYRLRLEGLLMRCRPPAGGDTVAAALRQDVERLAVLESDKLPPFMVDHLPRVRRFLERL